MTIRTAVGVPLATSVLALALFTGCTGGSETKASDQAESASESTAAKTPVNATQEIAQINPLARDIAPERAAQQQGTPYHQGAIRYYKEIKIWREVER